MLFGIESSLGGTSTRWLDCLLFLVAVRSDHLTIGSSTVLTYAFAFTLLWREHGDLTGSGRGVAAAAPAAGGVLVGCFLGAAFCVADLKTVFPLEAPTVSLLE